MVGDMLKIELSDWIFNGSSIWSLKSNLKCSAVEL